MDKLYIIIPAYNERENIKSVIADWYPIVEKYNCGGQSRLVIINDGSRDDTYEIMCEYGKDKPLFLPLTKENGGHGATLLYGYNYALENGADFIFQTDSDGQTLSSEFHKFWDLRYDYDLVIGNRNKREDGLSRKMVTFVLKAVLKICFGVTVTDANTPFRLMKADTLGKYIKYIPEGFNLSNVILSVIYVKKKLKVKFIPITFRPRQGGVNSINLPKIFKIGEKAVVDFIKINKTLDDI
ncbi:MAG: glycosyltransferase family 2 protein [Clostridia bacterium]